MSKWEMVRLGDVCETGSGGTPNRSKSEYYGGNIPLVKSGDLGQGLITKVDEYITEKGLAESSAKIVRAGTVLIALYGATVGKLGILGFDAATNQAVCNLQPSMVLDKKFLFFYLESHKSQLLASSIGGAQPNISQSIIKDLRIPLPPLATQQKIAAILDKADALRRKDKALLAKYDELAQAIFVDMFGDPVKNEKGWEVRRLGEVCEKIQIGPFGTQLHQSDYIEGGIPLINPMHIKEKSIVPNSNYSITRLKFAELIDYHLQEGDVILGRRGEMGRAALVTDKENGFLCGTGSLFIRPNRSLVSSDYLCDLLTSKSVKAKLEKESSGTTMMNLNKNVMASLHINMPSLEMQATYSRAIKQCSDMRTHSYLGFIHSETLFQSLLQRAFRGELVE